MPDAEWIENIKRIVSKAEEVAGPCDVIPGTVVSISPLSIQIDQKTILTGPQILLSRCVTDHEEKMMVPELGEVSVTMKSGLQAGETVMLIQKRGGQQYAVIDRW